MALTKGSLPINFAQGLDTKTDPWQLSPGKFLTLQNTIFTKGGLLQKRNGYPQLQSLPDNSNTAITTFNGNLTAIGSSLFAYSDSTNQWYDKGAIQPVQLNVLPLIRSNTNQIQSDIAISPSGLVCTVYTDNLGSTTDYKYAIADSTTGQNIIEPTLIPSGGTVLGSPRVFTLNRHFIIVYGADYSGVNHLQYIAITIVNPTQVTTPVDISTQYTPNSRGNFDGVIANDSLYLAWNGNDVGGAIRFSGINAALTQYGTKSIAGHNASTLSLTVDTSPSTAVLYASFIDSSNNGYTCAVSTVSNFSTVLAPVQLYASVPSVNIASCAQNGINTIFYEVTNSYSYDTSIPTNYVEKITCTQAGVLSSPVIIDRSVGLASKAFAINSVIYILTTYQSDFQPSYFLIDLNGNVISTLAYSNGGGYITLGLPSVYVNGTSATTSYGFKDLIEAVNKTQGVANAAGVYAQVGINDATFNITSNNIITAEIGNNLLISGGFLWAYDGYVSTEQQFFLYPDNVEVTTATTGGDLIAQTYFYQAIYEWSDNQGNIIRSAPSVPVSIVTTGSTSANTVYVPTLRLTYKTANPVKIVIYRWSTAQQDYYQITSITSPLLNDKTVDFVTFVDTQSDADILGNSLIYTTGGVVEDVGAPAVATMTLFQDRLWTLDAEDRNLLYFSKQVIEGTPVEMSDLFTFYVAPTTSAQGSTGPITALSAMDDKLLIFKENAIYYVNGQGPDNTGANNQFSDPVFITATVGCINQQSIVFTPNGLMFQSDKGIWLLGRDLSTNYIGAPVEQFNGDTINSAVNVPGTNQVLFTLNSGTTLMYDYYYGQWGTFTNVPAISSTLYQGLHTYINSVGQVYQQSPGTYLDGSNPVLMSFTTSWLNLAGLQGYQRAYFFYILGQYLSPHKLSVSIAYDYNPTFVQNDLIMPDNYAGAYGSAPLYGNGVYGGASNVEPWRVFLQRGKCESFQITITEVFDPQFGTVPGAGLTISGLDVIVGVKGNYPRRSAARSVG